MTGVPNHLIEFIQKKTPPAIVSRETIQHLEDFVGEVLEWQERFNLISTPSIPEIWERHVMDSLQLIPLMDEQAKTVIDLGSGGGFPAIPLSIFLDKKFILVESITKKCTFLKIASRHGVQNGEVWNERIEGLKNIQGDIITARALASLKDLLKLALPLCHEKTQILFLKGAQVDAEIEDALRTYTFSLEKIPSITSDTGTILKIWNLRKK